MSQRAGVTRAAAAAPITTLDKTTVTPPLSSRPLSSSDSDHLLRVKSYQRETPSDNNLGGSPKGLQQSQLSTATSISTGLQVQGNNANKRKTASLATKDTLRGSRRSTRSTQKKGKRCEEQETSAKGTGDAGLDTAMAVNRSWVLFALASGCFAALNGAFAKLTTTASTSSLALAIHNAIPILPIALTETLTRALFFALNLVSNGIMWTLFTRALTSHPSATKVSLVNTSSNFLLTALLGAVIFAEKLKGLWWLGAGMLVIGNLVVGRGRHEDEDVKGVLEGDDDKGPGDGSSTRERQKAEDRERQALLGGDEVDGIRADGEDERADLDERA